MILIVCVDDGMGMAFNGRRQSRDRLVCERICEIVGENTLWLNEYSAPLFKDFKNIKLRVQDDFLCHTTENSYCFVENADVSQLEDRMEKVILYKWNRKYPVDLQFGLPLNAHGWRLLTTQDFRGNSHEKITEEVYVK